MVRRLSVSAAVCMTRLPVGTEPVIDTLATPGCEARAAPVVPAPWTTLNTPGGKPASA